MKLTQLASKPKLIKLQLDDAETIEQYKEPLDFYIYDRQPLEQFIKIATMKNDNPEELIILVKNMVLDEEGNEVIKDGYNLPTSVLSKVIAKVVDTLGK